MTPCSMLQCKEKLLSGYMQDSEKAEGFNVVDTVMCN